MELITNVYNQILAKMHTRSRINPRTFIIAATTSFDAGYYTTVLTESQSYLSIYLNGTNIDNAQLYLGCIYHELAEYTNVKNPV